MFHAMRTGRSNFRANPHLFICIVICATGHAFVTAHASFVSFLCLWAHKLLSPFCMVITSYKPLRNDSKSLGDDSKGWKDSSQILSSRWIHEWYIKGTIMSNSEEENSKSTSTALTRKIAAAFDSKSLLPECPIFPLKSCHWTSSCASLVVKPFSSSFFFIKLNSEVGTISDPQKINFCKELWIPLQSTEQNHLHFGSSCSKGRVDIPCCKKHILNKIHKIREKIPNLLLNHTTHYPASNQHGTPFHTRNKKKKKNNK